MFSFETTAAYLFIIGSTSISVCILLAIISEFDRNQKNFSNSLKEISINSLLIAILSFFFLFWVIVAVYNTPHIKDNVQFTLKEDKDGRAYLIDPINNQIVYPNQGKPGDTVQRYKTDVNFWKFPFFLTGKFVSYSYKPITKSE